MAPGEKNAFAFTSHFRFCSFVVAAFISYRHRRHRVFTLIINVHAITLGFLYYSIRNAPSPSLLISRRSSEGRAIPTITAIFKEEEKWISDSHEKRRKKKRGKARSLARARARAWILVLKAASR